MTSIPRNSPCPCGSGKKYKRCCIVESQSSLEMLQHLLETANTHQGKEAKFAYKLLQKYRSPLVLKVLSLLQLQPKNHGKNVRLEAAIIETIRNLNLEANNNDLSQLLRDIKSHLKKDFAEDPPEEFFTENIVFDNGNNLVFPGISTNGTEIVQVLINCVSQSDLFPTKFVDDVKDGILLILHIHSQIATRLGFIHRMFEEADSDDLFISDESDVNEKVKLFSFTQEAINSISKQLNVTPSTFDQFVYDHTNKNLNFSHHDANPLFQQPFVKIGEEFILVLPTAELICINDFVIRLAKNYKCLDPLLKLYAEKGREELYPCFGRMHWEYKPFAFSKVNEPTLYIQDESIWQIDTNKLVYAVLITEHPDHTQDHRHRDTFSLQYTKRVENESKLIKQSYPGFSILVIGIIQKSRVLGLFGMSLSHFKNSEYQIFFSQLELIVLSRVWKFDRLTLWKYCKYLHFAEEKIRFTPLNTHYSKYKWYMRNAESFSDPDEPPYNWASFGFEIEGDIRRKGLMQLDKIGIRFPSSGSSTYVQCYRKEEHYPVYISQAINYGHLHSCLLKYCCPIWFMPADRTETKAEVYINGFLYWLNELHTHTKDYINKLGCDPIIFVVSMSKEFNHLNDLEQYDNQPINIKYSVDKIRRKINIEIPAEILQFTSSPNNKGEQLLMAFIFDMLGVLMEALDINDRLTSEEHLSIIMEFIPLGNQKMISTATGDRDLTVAKIDIADIQIIPKADTSFLLESQVKWLNYPSQIPEKISNNEEKIKLFNDLVSIHFRQLEAELKKHHALSLLLFLMKRHETLIQTRAFRKITYPVKKSCYGKYYDVYKEFTETEGELNFCSLSVRTLIEFVACLMPTGNLSINDDDIDMLIARAGRIIHYGSISDEIKYGIREVEVGLLPSGRIGINYDIDRKKFDNFSNVVLGEEFDTLTENFSQVFYRRSREKDTIKRQNDYHQHVNDIFKKEWGIGLYDIPAISHFIAHYLFSLNKSVEVLEVQALLKIMKDNTDFTEEEVKSYIDHFTFMQRPSILQPPEGYTSQEVYPWRYNRRLSYLLRPLIRIKNNGVDLLIISVRHLWTASENLVASFGKGTLKVDNKFREITQLIADQNGIKGKEYRQEVYEWLNQNTTLSVTPYEVRISPKGQFKSITDLGDIDILAIDHNRKFIYSIECKNTHQSKVAYEYRMELNKYLGVPPKQGLISKHINRDKWLQENKKNVLSILNLSEDYQIHSLVVSNHVLPTKFLAAPAIPILSFYELKKNGVPIPN